jgi:hypothetical protein
MTTKICIHCNIEQDITLFEINKKKGKEYVRNVCRQCRKNQYTLSREKKAELVDYSDTTKTKKCVECKEEHNILQYNRNKNRKDGYHDICKKCNSIKRQEEYQERKNRIIITNITHKICHTCKTSKEITKFKQTACSKDGYFQICIDCRPDNWTKEKQRASDNKYKNDPKNIVNVKIRGALNSRIKLALLTNDKKKEYNTFKYTGCSEDYLKKWFEYLFEDGMTWENHGEWHIDHVVPCISFDLSSEEEQKECFSWKNLRPCWAKENIIKGGKIIPDIINSHNKKVNEFINSTTKPI